jgi:TRAP transporter 4TM/12TM fusion protein
MDNSNSQSTSQTANAEDIVASSETGGRQPIGMAAKVIVYTCLAWSIFQLWYVSPYFYLFDLGVSNDTLARSVHLAFAMFLTFLVFPARKRSPKDYIPILDWVFAITGALCASYLYIFYSELADRPGLPTTLDIVASVIGMVLLLEATRRAIGPPLMIVALVFLVYTFFGPYMPEVIAHKGASLNKTMSHQWLSTEGVFGVAIGVSTSFVFLFVLFGTLLEHAGAGNYFIKLAFSLLGHFKGGPAKAAVVASGFSGIISGSSIANVVTTGTFTIPLMKRVGFSGEKAGAVEVAASTNGQLTPPIMGAAAFLMVEYVGIPYIEVIQHAILPAMISYIALVYIVHLEALKADMKGMQRRNTQSLAERSTVWVGILVGFCLLSFAVYYGIGWIKMYLGDWAFPLISVLVAGTYVGLVAWGARYPELELDDLNSEELIMPEVGPTLKSGLYFLLPIVVLIWCLMVERFSPGLSAFWSTLFMVFIVLTHKPLKAFFRGESWLAKLNQGRLDLFHGFVDGAKNMIGIAVATAAAGIVVGTVTLTGIGLVMTEFVELISGGNIILMLVFTAIISLVLGMGLPTTANYIVVSTLMAPVIVTLGAESGLVVPLIAVHLFVFYFGILADDTPPVGLAAYAAAAIAKSDPIKTGIQGFTYDIRTAILPFMFIFNTQLLLIGIDSIWDLIWTVYGAIAAMLIFAAATQGFWLRKNFWWETVLLLFFTFCLFRPGYFWDQWFDPYENVPANQFSQTIEQIAVGDTLRLYAEGENLEGDFVEKMVLFSKLSEENILDEFGATFSVQDDVLITDFVMYDSPAYKAGLDFDFKITSFDQPSERATKFWLYVPVSLALMLMIWYQRRSRKKLNA